MFYYELASPACYLMAEQVMSALPVVPEWEPVHGGTQETDPESLGYVALDRDAVEREAAKLGLQRFRWPSPWPPDSAFAMLAATYAKRIGRGVAFSLAAFRQAFAGGRDLGDRDTVLIAAAACEMHPTALLKGVGLRSVAESLADANARARQRGVSRLPAIGVRELIFDGPGAIDAAARALEDSG